MANDALDPGPNGDYPHWPRNPDGTTDTERMPSGPRTMRDRTDALGNPVVYDPAPGNPDGSRVEPPA